MRTWPSLQTSRPYAWPLAEQWSVRDTALLSIDMQRDFLSPDGYFASLGEDLSHVRRGIAPAEKVLLAARKAGLFIIHTRESHRPDLSDLHDNKRRKAERAGAPIGSVGPMGRLLVRGELGCDFIASLKPEAGEIVIDKPGNGAFFATDLELILRVRNIKNIILMGVTTDVCVSSTMRDANDRGFDCLLLEDCCGAATAPLHEAVIAGLSREGGIFGAYITSEDLIRQMGV
ncbi:isochorismatase family cysteine hydrolase [Hyphomicrobium sp. CS1GBMeth3]|uniref:cysteine hydrolase family protein n=1 Tax=Hyphomicrobium sp. CS1GBMeth3 TaxID=1892845 RepID=UPI00093164C8|nr:isochorismatase family cysteine hydrolase [Hyphomicrobium sp. CS1GBMeth3]